MSPVDLRAQTQALADVLGESAARLVGLGYDCRSFDLMPMAPKVELCKPGQQFGDPRGHGLVLASAFLANGKAIPSVCVQLALSMCGSAIVILCEVRARMRAAQRAQRAQPHVP